MLLLSVWVSCTFLFFSHLIYIPSDGNNCVTSNSVTYLTYYCFHRYTLYYIRIYYYKKNDHRLHWYQLPDAPKWWRYIRVTILSMQQTKCVCTHAGLSFDARSKMLGARSTRSAHALTTHLCAQLCLLGARSNLPLLCLFNSEFQRSFKIMNKIWACTSHFWCTWKLSSTRSQPIMLCCASGL